MTSLEDIMPGVRNCIKNWACVSTGEEVLVVSDTTLDPMVAQAFFIASQELGGVPAIACIKGQSDLPLWKTAFIGRPWWPKCVWEGGMNADVLINLTGFFEVHTISRGPEIWKGVGIMGPDETAPLRNTPLRWGNVRWVGVECNTPEQLASTWGTFPKDLGDLIGEKANQAVAGGKKVRVTDREGTNLSFEEYFNPSDYFGKGGTVGAAGSSEAKPRYGLFNAYMVGLIPTLHNSSASGKIVSHSLHFGPIPMTEITLKGGRAVKIEGGGVTAAAFRDIIKRYADIDFGNHQGPGADYFEECMWGTSPKARQAYHGALTGSNLVWGWVGGGRRSGCLHMAIGTGGYSKTSPSPEVADKLDIPADKRHMPLELVHIDFEIYHPTVTIDGKPVIEDGHLLVLDDPEVREAARKYGNPDDVLREEWDPVGVPL